MGKPPLSQPRKVKIVVIGDAAVGKTCLINAAAGMPLGPDFHGTPTTSCNFTSLPAVVGDQVISLTLWDTAGQECYRSITKAYFRGAEGAIVAFDTTRAPTLCSTKAWVDALEDVLGKVPPIVLVGNKIDAERQVKRSQGDQMARQLGADYFETSSMKGNGGTLMAPFIHLAEEILARPPPEEPRAPMSRRMPPRKRCC